MPRHQQNFDEETAAARQRLIEQLQQLSRAFVIPAGNGSVYARDRKLGF